LQWIVAMIASFVSAPEVRDGNRKWWRLGGLPALVAMGVNAFALVLPIDRTTVGLCWYALLVLVYLIALALLAWPLSSFRVAAIVSLAAASGNAAVGVVRDIHAYLKGFIQPWWVIPLMVPAASLVIWGIGWLFLIAVTLVRRRWWPIRAPGTCRFCGYVLYGLPSPSTSVKFSRLWQKRLEMPLVPVYNVRCQ
jgi:hypothetical protein